jgi:hypothetical protein
VLLWEFDSKVVESVQLPPQIRDPTFIRWSKASHLPPPPSAPAGAVGAAVSGASAGAAASASASGGASAAASGAGAAGANAALQQQPLVAGAGPQLAIGTAKGDVLLYDRTSRTLWFAGAKHRKRVSCGDWNSEGKFAFASDDRQVPPATLPLSVDRHTHFLTSVCCVVDW